MLLRIRVATTDQIARVVFGAEAPATARRLANRHLKRLTDMALVKQFPNTVVTMRSGPRGPIHVLTTGGARLVADGAIYASAQRKTWHPGPSKLAHWLAIGDLYVHLVEDQRHGGPEVLEFSVEAAARREYVDSYGRTKVLRPDAMVRLLHGETELSWFIEIDRGTEGLRTIQQKCRSYRDYELSDFEYARFGIFPAVLFVTEDQHRADNIARVIAAQPADARGLYRVTTHDDAPRLLRSPEFLQPDL